MSPSGPPLSREAVSVLRVLFRLRDRSSGDEVMERLFATTSEIPLDIDGVCQAVRELAARGFAGVDSQGKADPGFDFALAWITDAGRDHLVS